MREFAGFLRKCPKTFDKDCRWLLTEIPQSSSFIVHRIKLVINDQIMFNLRPIRSMFVKAVLRGKRMVFWMAFFVVFFLVLFFSPRPAIIPLLTSPQEISERD